MFPKSMLKFTALALLTTGLFVLSIALPKSDVLPGANPSNPSPVISLGTQSAIAQTVRIGELWQEVYAQMPDLPLENQYVSRDTGRVATNSTLANRLIRYHTFVKGRAPTYRFDWKLTLADYLGANERIIPGTYPGADSFTNSPLDGDRAAIRKLNRAQRDQLVNILTTIFSTPDDSTTSNPSANPSPSTTPTPRPAASPSPAGPTEARPGDARLLLP
jgi:hypothetical protein